MFHLVSLSLQISLTDLPGPCLGLCVGVACFVACLGGFVVGFFLTGKFDLNHMLIPVVDRPCLALVRQCRKKKHCHDLYLLLSIVFCVMWIISDLHVLTLLQNDGFSKV